MEDALKTLGLNEAEIKVYIACLKLGLSKASQIAESARIERQAVYYSLKLLSQKGVVTETIKSGVTFYACVDPLLLISTTEEEQKKKELALKELHNKFKEFNATSIKRPRVEQYEGAGGLKTADIEIISGEDSEVCAYQTKKMMNLDSIYIDNYVAKRKEKKIRLKLITEKEISPELKEKGANREIRVLTNVLDGKDYSFAILKDKVIFLRATEKDQYGIKIEDREFAEFQMNLFKLVWDKLAEK